MIKTKKKEKNKGLRSALLFVFLVLSIIAFSFLLKAIHTFKQSIYDGHNRFTIEILRSGNPQVLSFYPENRQISIYTFSGREQAFKTLEIPFDTATRSNIVFNKDNFSNEVSSLLFRSQNSMVFYDKFRLFYFVETFPSKSIEANNINSAADLSKLFFENQIQKEDKTIQIINATGESGFANRLSSVISNMGGDVILLTTAQSPLKQSLITYSDESYTVKKLTSYLGFKKQKDSQQGIANITIIIGEDSLGSQKF